MTTIHQTLLAVRELLAVRFPPLVTKIVMSRCEHGQPKLRIPGSGPLPPGSIYLDDIDRYLASIGSDFRVDHLTGGNIVLKRIGVHSLEDEMELLDRALEETKPQ